MSTQTITVQGGASGLQENPGGDPASQLARDGGWLAPGPNSKWRLSFGGILRGEMRKMFSLRSTIWCTLLVLLLAIGGTFAWTMVLLSEKTLQYDSLLENLHETVQLPQAFAALVISVLGVLIATSEYSSKMIISTLTVAPRRGMLFSAKALAAALYGLVLGLVINVVPAVLCAAMYGTKGLEVLGNWRFLLALGLSSVYYMVVSLVSFGVGMLVRSTAGAVSIMMTLLFVIMIVINMLSAFQKPWVNFISDYCLPMLGGRITTMAAFPDAIPAGVTGWHLAAGLSFWCVAALLPAGILFKKRDVI